MEDHTGNVSRARHRRRRRRVAEPGQEIVGGGAAGAVPHLDVVEAAVLVTLDPERREVELDSLPQGGDHGPLAVPLKRVVARVPWRVDGAVCRALDPTAAHCVAISIGLKNRPKNCQKIAKKLPKIQIEMDTCNINCFKSQKIINQKVA